MPLFKKFFGDEEEKKLKALEQRAEILERAPRIRLLPLHNIEFTLKHPSATYHIKLANLSLSGAGFIRSTAISWPPVGTILRGDFKVEKKNYPVCAQIVHISPLVVGCSYEGDVSGVQGMIKDYFRVEMLALKMIEVHPGDIPGKKEAEGIPRWFRGQDNCELFLVVEGTDVVRFQMCVFGNYIEGGESNKLSYGTVLGDIDEKKPRSKASSSIRTTEKISIEVMDTAIKFAENIESLAPEYRSAICARLDAARKQMI